ncbi:MAG: membrane or secreted protein [Cyclobacteriaceae bacterium]
MKHLNKTLLGTLLFLAAFGLWSCGGNQTKDTTAATEPAPVDHTENIQGAWTASWSNEAGQEVEAMVIVVDGYIAETFYNRSEKRFDGTMGGSYTVDGNKFNFSFEFNTLDTTKVGTTDVLTFDLKGDTILFEGDDRVWTRVDDGTPGELSGAYLITGRKRDGEISRSTPGARKTMKILSGTRFQWIAYHTETTRFSGTGGGTYTTVGDDYTENIEFFSRDSSRVGASLSFKWALDSGEWHHSGYSSKGDPMYEIWTPRSMLDAAASNE